MANFSVPMRTVFQQAGDAMVMLTAMMRWMKLDVVSYLPAPCTDCMGLIAPTTVETVWGTRAVILFYRLSTVITCFKRGHGICLFYFNFYRECL